MLRRASYATLIFLVVLVCTGARPPKPMYKPTPTPLPTGVSIEEAVGAVKAALAGRGWMVESDEQKEGERALIATLLLRVHMVKIEIRIDDDDISIMYVDSKQMRYRKLSGGAEQIHPKYTQWIMNVEADLRLQLATRAE